jgi:hypothetical protein
MRAPSSIPFCPYDGRQAGLLYLPACWRYTTQLGAELGFEMLDAGPLRIARLLEPLAMLWIHLAVFQGLGPDIALTLQRR